MNHALCALIHYVYARHLSGETINGFSRVPVEMAGELPEAIRLRLVESRGPDGTLDYFWARLTDPGTTAALEGRCAMEEVA